ncbi:hypothetical protein O0L34_g11477 [Tuta absoluta]|nr:hypothetical protein O0L34_g11477 [Tuta absoluta]
MASLILSLVTIVMVAVACQGNYQTRGRIARFGETNRYFLYTRDNPRKIQPVLPTVVAVNAIRTWRENTVILIHDLKEGYSTGLNPTVKDALLTAEDVNVIILDWSFVARLDVSEVIGDLPQVAEGARDFIRILVQTRKVSLDKLHLVGHGMGAHLAAYIARLFDNPQIARITGLDPAGNMGNGIALRKDDAAYVEVIHTDDSGISDAIGDVDFFPNGGSSQTDCSTSKCNHERAWEFFSASLTHPGSLQGNKCLTGAGVAPIAENCKGYVLEMGNNQYVKYGDGKYFVAANGKYPFYNECEDLCPK